MIRFACEPPAPLVREERLHGADDNESRRRHGKLTQNNEHDGGGCPAPEERDARATLKLRKRLPGLVELSLALVEAVPVNLPRVEGVSPLLSFELQDHSHTVGAVIPLRHAVTANGLAELGRVGSRRGRPQKPAPTRSCWAATLPPRGSGSPSLPHQPVGYSIPRASSTLWWPTRAPTTCAITAPAHLQVATIIWNTA